MQGNLLRRKQTPAAAEAEQETPAVAEAEQEAPPSQPVTTVPLTEMIDRCKIVLIGGYPGAGVRTQVALSAALMRARGFEVVKILTDSYHSSVQSTLCQVCKAMAQTYGTFNHSYCRLCPESLDAPSLIRTVNKGINAYTSHTDFMQSDKRVILYVAGRNALECLTLVAAASAIIWVDLEANTDLCAIRRLRSDYLWIPDLGEDLTNPAVAAQIARLREANNHALTRLFAHAQQYDGVVTSYATQADTYRRCDAANKSAVEVAMTFNRVISVYSI